MTRQSYGAVRGEWIRSEAPWWNAAGATPVPYCRPPYGDYNGTTVAASGVGRLHARDPVGRGPAGLERARAPASSPSACSRTCAPGRSSSCTCAPQTAAALPAILSGLRARGYKAVSLPELFRAAGYR